jgi:hypothetical protein
MEKSVRIASIIKPTPTTAPQACFSKKWKLSPWLAGSK